MKKPEKMNAREFGQYLRRKGETPSNTPTEDMPPFSRPFRETEVDESEPTKIDAADIGILTRIADDLAASEDLLDQAWAIHVREMDQLFRSLASHEVLTYNPSTHRVVPALLAECLAADIEECLSDISRIADTSLDATQQGTVRALRGIYEKLRQRLLAKQSGFLTVPRSDALLVVGLASRIPESRDSDDLFKIVSRWLSCASSPSKD